MCDVCKAEKMDSKFRNGNKNFLVRAELYKVFKGNIAIVNLCYIHSLELFWWGEKRFLLTHLKFARHLATQTHISQSENGYAHLYEDLNLSA